MSSDILSKIIEQKGRRLADAKAARPLEEVRGAALEVRADARPHVFRQALEDAGRVNVIAEFKRASPSKGEIRGGASVAEIVSAYERGGAAALSVLTEEDFFRGSLADLREAKTHTRLPVLRKDFVFDDYQVYESAANGADALLLIVAALDDETLGRLLRLTEDELHMDALVEVHTAGELERALRLDARIVGVNNRDLRTFEVTLRTSIELSALAPPDTILVSESGLRGAGDVDRLRSCGFRAFLVGETLMRAEDPEAALRYLAGAGGWGEAAV
ncbi:MAG: indole-3-glycerol phosphate synthase TrpC [Acidobacteria bacterium]|nr:indole-3-glycerol phosphate synthase TrpC [Acidobacteriota bacterium]